MINSPFSMNCGEFFSLSFSCSPDFDTQVDAVKVVDSYKKPQSIAVQCGIPNCHHQAHALNSVLCSGAHGLSQTGKAGDTALKKSSRSHICSMFEPFQVKILF